MHRTGLLRAAALVFLLLPGWSSLARAHHSAAAFDPAGNTVIEGTIARVDWRSPHVYLTVRDRKGKLWVVEAGPPGVIARAGFRRETLKVDDAVIVHGRPHRNPAKPEVLFVSMTRGDGSAFPMNPATPPAVPWRASSLAGIWIGEGASAVSFLRQLPEHPLTEAGRAARAAFRPEMDPSARCVAWTSPFIVLATAVYPTTITLKATSVVFQSEFYAARRVVHLDRREHPVHGKASPQGDSVGWWEGRTLVVDTRQFAPTRSQFRDPYEGLPSGSDKHVVERYTLSEDGTSLKVEVFMEDPQYLARPLTGSFIWRYAPDMPVVDGKCDRKSARQFLR